MASQHGSRFISPVGNQNFSPNVFNANPTMDRHPASQFQRPPNPPNGSFQSSERFVHGFQNRPQFSNFPGACGFLNRPPPVPPSSAAHPPPHPASNFFPGPPNSHSTFPAGLSNPPPFPGGPTNPSPFSGGPTNSSPFPGGPTNSCPFPGGPTNSSSFPGGPTNSSPFPGGPTNSSSFPCSPTNSSPFPVTSNPSPFSVSSNPPPFPVSSNPPHFSNAPNCPSPFLSSSTPFPPQSHVQSGTFTTRTSLPPPISHPSLHTPQPPFSSQRPFSPHQPSPVPNVPQQNQFNSVSHHPNQQQRFRMNSPSPAPRPRFENTFQRPYRPWNQTTRFSGPKTPFSNRSPNVVKSNQFKDISQQFNKKKKEKSREFRKLKDDSTEKPYSCDTCDRAFITENELSDHFSQHTKCDYETCTFEAHPKIVLLHKKMQHETGYAERINKLKDDAEVRKWREERRKRFPTAENIKKRQAEQAEREARGEVLETKEFGKFKRRSEGNGNLANNDGDNHRGRTRGHRGRGGRRGKRNHFRRNFHEPDFQRFKVNSESGSDSDSHISLNMFSGLSSLSNPPEEEKCHSNETVETSSLDQNLQNSISSIDKNHLNQPHSEINLTDRKKELTVLSNAELRGKKRTADESIIEIPEDEIVKPKRQLIAIEDSDDEGSEVIPINKYQVEANKMEDKGTRPNTDSVVEDTNRGRKRTADESIIEVPEDEIVKTKKQLIVIEGSDDEGPEAMSISRCEEEISICEKGKKIGSDVNDEPKVSEMNGEDVSKSNEARRHRTRRENNFSAKQYAPNKIRKSSLLEKLLADDIRHERNVILQCIRHIVNNNFFGLAVKKS